MTTLGAANATGAVACDGVTAIGQCSWRSAGSAGSVGSVASVGSVRSVGAKLAGSMSSPCSSHVSWRVTPMCTSIESCAVNASANEVADATRARHTRELRDLRDMRADVPSPTRDGNWRGAQCPVEEKRLSRLVPNPAQIDAAAYGAVGNAVVVGMLKPLTDKRPTLRLRLARDPGDPGGAHSDERTRLMRRRAPRAGSARALTAGDVHRTLEQLADVVTAVRDIARPPTEAHGPAASRPHQGPPAHAIAARRSLERDVRPLVFAGNCLWAAADGWQEHEALGDLQRYGGRALESALKMREGTGEALDAAALFRTEHALRALVMTVVDQLEISAANASPPTSHPAHPPQKKA